jgi:arylsulfatase A-like enzyme
MNGRWAAIWGFAALVAALATCGPASAADGAKRPNIVFVLSDDHNYQALGIAGHPRLKTPNIDQIARDGAWLRQACVATPLCAPSRTAFLTGLYGHRSGFRTNGGPWPKEFPPSFLSVAHDAGYRTAFIGKKHIYNTDESLPGVDRWVSFVDQGLFVDPYVNIDGERKQLKGANGDLLTSFALDFIRDNKEKPFALVVAYKEAHSQQTAPPRFDSLFENDAVPLPETFDEDKSKKPSFFSTPKTFPDSGFDEGKPHPVNGLSREDLAIKKIKNYDRCVSALDDYVGKIVAALKEVGKLDDTILVFAGDNGYFLGDHGRFEKMTPHEESVRVPFLIRYPAAIKPGTVSDALALNIDLAPTLYDLADLKGPEGLDGRSLKPVLASGDPTGASVGWRQDVYLEWQGPQGAVPRGAPGTVPAPQQKVAAAKKKANPAAQIAIPTWRSLRSRDTQYAVYLDGELSELYDLRSDPKETRNLIDDPSQKERVAALHARLLQLADETKDPLRSLIPAGPVTR